MQDTRHGKARGEVIRGGRGANRLRQIAFVTLVLVGGIGFLVLAATLLGPDPNSSPILRYVAYGVLVALALLGILWKVRQRRSRQSLDDTLRSGRAEDQLD